MVLTYSTEFTEVNVIRKELSLLYLTALFKIRQMYLNKLN